MERRQFLANTVAAPAALAAQQGQRLPNLVFFLSDDHTAADLGCYGNRAVTTPNLDRLAAEGMRFENCFVSSPQCSPNRSSIFTGCSPHTTSTSRLHTPLPDWEPTVIDALKTRGYFTGIFRKHHQGPGFQRKLDFYGDAKANFASFFDAKPQDKPFFLQIGFTDPHRPYQAGAFSPPHDPAQVKVPDWLPDWPEVRQDLAYYYDYIARMDAEVGQFMALLRSRGLADNTLVIMSGDNGMPFPRAKGGLYEAGINVPLLAWWPGRVAAGAVKRELIAHVDLPSTWMEAAGIAPTKKMQGRSFLPLLEGKTYTPRTEIFSERNWHDNFDPMRCIRTDRYKYIFNAAPHFPYRPASDLEDSLTWKAMLAKRRTNIPVALRHLFNPTRPIGQLFDLAEDPLELVNLVDSPKHATLRMELEVKLGKWMESTYDFLQPAGAGFGNLNTRTWPTSL
jgi:N-sulfoglucosamine sulfohydrolase